MDFHEAEQQFRVLEKSRRAGHISDEAYRQQLVNLRVRDVSGATWQMQAETGKWYVYRDGQWRPAVPPRASGKPRAAAPTGSSQAPKTRSGPLLVVVGLAGLCLLCLALAGAGYYVYQNDLLANSPLATLLNPAEQPQGAPQASSATETAPAQAEVKPLGAITAAADGSAHSTSGAGPLRSFPKKRSRR